MSVEKEYFLVVATIEYNEYMQDNPTRVFQDTRLVLAETLSDARAKYQRYWEQKSQPYGDYYVVRDFEATDAIQ